MSFRAMTWAATVKTNTPTQKLILLLLADRAGNDGGDCWPSLNRIAQDACVSRRCVIENIKKLAAHGFLWVEKRVIEAEEGSNVHNKSNVYHLNVGTAPLGVVNDMHQGGERGSLGVVNDMHPNQSVETINEPTPAESGGIVQEQNRSKPNADERDHGDIGSALFDEFWAVYPRRVGKGAARKAFAKAVKITEAQVIVSAVERHKRSEGWVKESGKYIPHPATWLNQERWDDEVFTKPTAPVPFTITKDML